MGRRLVFNALSKGGTVRKADVPKFEFAPTDATIRGRISDGLIRGEYTPPAPGTRYR
jgi:hypothetical protein